MTRPAATSPWKFTKSGSPRGFFVARAGEAMPRLRAEEPALEPPEPSKSSSNAIFIYDFVGYDFWTGTGISARQVIEALEEFGPDADVDVRINSPGGDVFEGIAIFNALARHKGQVTVHVDALAASMASLVMLAGRRVLVAENALVMLHLPWTITIGNSEDHRATAAILEQTWAAMVATYARRTGMTPAAIRKRVSEAPHGEWWLTAEDAVKAGFADEIESPGSVSAMAEGALFRGAPQSVTGVEAPDEARPGGRRQVPEIVTPPCEEAAAELDLLEREFAATYPDRPEAGAYTPRRQS